MLPKRIAQILIFCLIMAISCQAFGLQQLRKTTIPLMAAHNGALLSDGDLCQIILAGGLVLNYYLNATSGATNDSYFVVAPDTNPGSKRWLLKYPLSGLNEVSIRMFDNLNAALLAIGSQNITLEWDSNVALTATTTDPNNIDINMGPNGVIVLGDYDLHIWGNFSCPDLQKVFSFTGIGRVYFHSGASPHVSVCWTGAKGDGATDSLLPYRYAVTALGSEGNGVNKLVTPFTGLGYKISDEVTITRGKLHIDFQDNVTSTNTDPNCMFYIYGTNENELQNIRITGNNITLDGNGSNVVGYTYNTNKIHDVIFIDYADHVYIEGIHCTDGLLNGMTLNHTHDSTIINCEFSYSVYDNGLTIGYDHITYIGTDPNDCALSRVISCTSHDNPDTGFTAIQAHHVTFENCTTWWNGWYGYTSEVISSALDLYTTFRGCKSFNDDGGFEITADEVTIEGCQGYGNLQTDPNDTNYTSNNGVYAYNVQGLKIKDSEFSNYGRHGIHVRGYDPTYSAAYISNCIVHDNTAAGIKGRGLSSIIIDGGYIYSNDAQGVYVSNETSGFNPGEGYAEIKNCSIRENDGAGVRSWYLDSLYLDNNIFKNNAKEVIAGENAGISTWENDYTFAKNNQVSYTDPNSNHTYGISIGGVAGGKYFEGLNNRCRGINGGFFTDTGIIVAAYDLGNDYSTDVAWPLAIKNDRNTSDADFGVGLKFRLNLHDYGDRWAGIAGCAENAGGSNTGMAFYTATGAAPTEKFRIANTGLISFKQTGELKHYTYQADALADDGTVTLADATSGIVIVSCNAEAGMWLVQADGTVTKISGSTNTAATDSDGNLCVYDGGTAAVVKNRLGTTGEIRIIYDYN